jgi:hypothetical protein
MYAMKQPGCSSGELKRLAVQSVTSIQRELRFATAGPVADWLLGTRSHETVAVLGTKSRHGDHRFSF